MTDEPKINKIICEKIEPLFEIWKREAKWTEEEACVMWNKLFNPEKPTDEVIIDILADEFNRSYEFYHRTKVSKIYRKAKRKLNKVLP